MDGQEGRAGREGEQHEANTDDEVDEAGADVEPPVAMVDSKNAPFRDDDEHETDDAVPRNNGRADRNNGEQKVENDMHKRA